MPVQHRSTWRPSGVVGPATVLFCDVSGSTAMGERLDAEAVRELMFRYFHEMRSAIEGHGGTVEKFVGDAVMAVFGVPEAHEDDPVRACRAAFEMQQRLPELNDELDRRYGSRLSLRIGVNTGEVVAGDASTRETFVSTVAREALVVRGRCLPYGEGITYWPLGEIVRAAAVIREEHSRNQARERMARLFAGEPEADALASALGSAVGIAETTASPEEIAWAARRLAERLAGSRPLVLLVDDTQWAEEPLLELLEEIASRGRGAVMLLELARPELWTRRGPSRTRGARA